MTKVRRIAQEDLAAFAELLRRESGITLDATKGYLVETRLARVMEREGIRSFAELTRRGIADTRLRGELVDAMTTNETSFFRDPKTFDVLAHKLIPGHFERHGFQCPLRIWSAASSSGQEIYSVAMVLRELLGPLTGRHIQLVGTDISPSMLAQASRGVYTAHEVSRGLSERRRAMHFVAQGDGYRIKDELRGLVTFEQLNLLDPRAATRLGRRFDIVLCRNVAIYFDGAGRRQLWSTVSGALAPDAVLVLGSTETLRDASDLFERVDFRGVGYYRARAAGAARSLAPPTTRTGALSRLSRRPSLDVGGRSPSPAGSPRAAPVTRSAPPIGRAPETGARPAVVGRVLGVPIASEGARSRTEVPRGSTPSPRNPPGGAAPRKTSVYPPVKREAAGAPRAQRGAAGAGGEEPRRPRTGLFPKPPPRPRTAVHPKVGAGTKEGGEAPT